MKDTMIGMLPSGTYCLARLDGTPYSMGEYEMLLRDFDGLKKERRNHVEDMETLKAACAERALCSVDRGEVEVLEDDLARIRSTVDVLRDENSNARDDLIIERGHSQLLKAELESLRATVASQAKRLEELDKTRTIVLGEGRVSVAVATKTKDGSLAITFKPLAEPAVIGTALPLGNVTRNDCLCIVEVHNRPAALVLERAVQEILKHLPE